ncbi:MAG: lysozyme inhibitor LprI family protein [Microcoleus sp.]|uniref:lysozyme inhibitor LprI family protein n=1 Tax=Microcoleus anatoxicus TaxID=2705319 RepID=UPI00297BC7CF|nr:MAG: DUF1311 domain-containing protein [Oscillatoriales cyanobacterium]TAF64636.1 MAG: DUF1311 domain-containing protein [Oscillatoriales cyanobacterium]
MRKRSLFRLIISLIFLSASSSVVLAQGRDASASKPAACNQPQTQAEVNNCFWALYKQADTKLNEVYKQVISKLNQRDRNKLIDEQLTWIPRRDTTCQNEVRSDRGGGGSNYGYVLNSCLTRVTEQRTAELEKFLQK